MPILGSIGILGSIVIINTLSAGGEYEAQLSWGGGSDKQFLI